MLRCDAELLVEAKKASAIGGQCTVFVLQYSGDPPGCTVVGAGTTLILAVVDSGHVWVANTGDSRGVFGNRCRREGTGYPQTV